MAEVNELICEDLDPGVQRHKDGTAKVRDLFDDKRNPTVQRREGLAGAKESIEDNHFRVPECEDDLKPPEKRVEHAR